MSTVSLTVVARMKAKPGKAIPLRQALEAIVAPSRKDAGCLNYDLHQSKEDPAQFLFHENWTSKTHLDAHLKQPHLQAFLAKANDLLAEPPQIGLWEKIG